MQPFDLPLLVAASLRRLHEARSIADSLQPASEVHELAMRAVFVLEDCHEVLRRLYDEALEAIRA